MDLHHHQYQQRDNLWLSVAHLSPPSAFPTATWEHRHRQELSLREALYSTYSNKQHQLSKSTSKDNGLNSFTSSVPQAQDLAFKLTPIREADLVSRCLYALQGIPVAVSELQILAKLFSGQVADRSLHRLPSLWQRSSSTKALGKLLFVFVQAGLVRCQLEEFVNFFLSSQNQGVAISQLHTNLQMEAGSLDSRKRKKKSKKKNMNLQNVTALSEEELQLSPPYSLVNQAFAKAVKSVLQGHLAALNTLTDSVLQRRSNSGSHSVNFSCSDEHAGAVIGLPSCDITLLELHLHTSVLRIQLQALASVCLCKGSAEAAGMQEWEDHVIGSVEGDFFTCEKFPGSGIMDLTSYPRGADLLTFLYRQLQEADSTHIELLRYLFSCACQPYLGFIHSWLYSATIKDPYKEFIVQEANSMVTAVSEAQANDLVSAPCFLEDVRTSLIRSGQQLQVLLKLIERGAADATSNNITCISKGFNMLETAMQAWTDLTGEKSVFFPSLIFNKQELDELVGERKRKRHNLMQDFDLLFCNLQSSTDDLRCQVGTKGSHFNQVDPRSMVSDMDAATVKPSTAQHVAVNGTEEEREDCALGSSKSPRKKEVLEVEDTVSTGAAEDQPFSSELNRESKQRKRWIEPMEVIILHGQPDEEASLVTQPVEANLELRGNVHYVSDHEVESGTFCNKLAEGLLFGLSTFNGAAKPYPYSPPVLTQASISSDLESQACIPSLQSLTLARSQHSGSFSCFCSDICLEEIGPNFFGRSSMHKLAQKYKSSNLPHSDGYKRNVTNFNTISQKFWNFEDCICDGSSYWDLVPSFSFTTAPNALSLDRRSVQLRQFVDQNESENVNAEGLDSTEIFSNLSSTLISSSHPFLQSSNVDPPVKLRAETPSERLEEDARLELLCNSTKRSQTAARGGATWQSYLGLRMHEDMRPDVARTAQESFEIPLEVVIDECIIQEVVLQYQCISRFSVRLLQEVFCLQDHLAALRRYFFMERGDWADTFTSALYHHAWYPTGSLHRQLEVQTLLEAAVQNSSCQEDGYAERLHVSVGKEYESFQSDTDSLDHVYINKTSLSAFDFISLGYHLEWPISLIITSNSLKLYNSTFSFLIRAKLTGHAVKDIWRFLKEVLHVSKKGGTAWKQDWINTLMLFRQQIDHFVTTLQGHIETQLLHNVWCKFLQALQSEGKDLLDLEAIHGLYLGDALHVCFLSEEMKSVRTCIDNIMQCLLDLSACLNILGKQHNGHPTLDSEKVQSAILEAKSCFELSVRQLLQIAQNRHNHFTLSQFWTRLDFNGFFRSMCLSYS